MNNQDLSKKTAGYAAAGYVRDGMVVGLGTGSTVKYFIEKLAQRAQNEELKIICIPTSVASEELALSLGLALTNLKEHPTIDLDIDGADEVDPKFNLIKGGGGALTREKIVAESSKKFFVVADGKKMVKRLGAFPVAIEVLPFAEGKAQRELKSLGGLPKKRENFTTDNGNIILDTKFNIVNPVKLEEDINSISGVIENGIFSRRKPEKVIIGMGGETRILERK